MEKKIITGDMLIMEVVEANENAPEILLGFGMHCLGCAIAHNETVAQAAEAHGIELEALLNALNA
jgi:hybrid cluster-associated redox disulfide protein